MLEVRRQCVAPAAATYMPGRNVAAAAGGSLPRPPPSFPPPSLPGEPGGTRTHDQSIKSRVLYRLSYRLTPNGER